MNNIEYVVIGELFTDIENRFVGSLAPDNFLTQKGREMFEFLDKNRDVRDDFITLVDRMNCASFKHIGIEDFAKAKALGINSLLLDKHIRILKKTVRDSKIREIISNTNMGFSDEEIEEIHRLTQRDLKDNIEVKSLSEIAESYPSELERRKDMYAQGVLYPTGYEHLDSYTGGLMKHNVFVVGGRTSLGKTTFMLNIIINLMKLKPDAKILYFTCEMSPVDLFDRIASNLSQIEAYKLKYGKIDFAGDEYKGIIEQLNSVYSKKNVNLFYAPSLNIDTIRIAVEKYKPDVAVLDHIQLLKVSGNNRAQAIEDAMYEVKGMASEYNLAMVVGSQISRESEKGDSKRKDMSPIYFKGSGGIEDCASVCCELRLSADNIKENPIWSIDLDLSKNRFGRVGKLSYQFDRKRLTFSEVFNEQML